VAALCDEIAFWLSEGRNPDHEVISAIRPSMATIPNSKLIMLSSPYARKGVLWELYKDHYGNDKSTDILVWQASTETMNPTLDRKVIAREKAKDATAAASEWDAVFRSDIETFVPLEWLESAVVKGRYELPPAGFAYSAFVDPSGGANDAFTLAIAHDDNGTLVQDVLRAAIPPFDPYRVVTEYAGLLRQYNISTVHGDRYAGAWVSEAFAARGVRYIPSPLTKSEIYLSFEPLLARGQVELLDDPTLFSELRGLERRTGRGRRDAIDHGPGQHDDSANSTAGVLTLLAGADSGFVFTNLEEKVCQA